MARENCEGQSTGLFSGPIPVKVKWTRTPPAFVHYGTHFLSFSSNYGHLSSLPDLLTWRGMLIEMSGHFGQCVPSAGVARDADGVVICLNFIFQLFLLPYFFTNGGLQQAVGGDGAVPEESIEVGIHRKEHRLQNTSDHRLKGVLLISTLPFNTLRSAVFSSTVERLLWHHTQIPKTRLEGEKRVKTLVVLDWQNNGEKSNTQRLSENTNL